MKRVKLSDYQQKQLDKIINYYSWFTFKANSKYNCPYWDFYDGNKKLGSIFYYGDWRIDSDPEKGWGEDFESFICDIHDFEED